MSYKTIALVLTITIENKTKTQNNNEIYHAKSRQKKHTINLTYTSKHNSEVCS